MSDAFLAALAGLLQQSKIGEGGVDSAAAAINARRTSSTLLLSPDVIQQHANLEPLVLALQSQAQQLLPLGMGLRLLALMQCSAALLMSVPRCAALHCAVP